MDQKSRFLWFLKAKRGLPPLPRRTIELIALIGISTTFFLLLQTRDLNTKLKKMQTKMQPDGSVDENRIDETNFASSAISTAQFLSSRTEVDASYYDTILGDSTLDDLNNTRLAEREIIFFNRVPKVGSQTIMELLRVLSIRNNFRNNRDSVQRVELVRMNPMDQLDLVSKISEFQPPSIFVKHVCFTNFTLYDLPMPIYINMVRDPVERVISWYYYIRAPWYFVERKQLFPELPLPDPKWLKKDFETCVRTNDKECRYVEGENADISDHRRQSLFFCGHTDACTPFNTVGVLERAKYNVEKYYSVVGVLEEMNVTLTVFENYIPRFFRDASTIYHLGMNSFKQINSNKFKPTVSEEVKEIVRKSFTREIEFYQFCRQRLHKQYAALKKNNLL